MEDKNKPNKPVKTLNELEKRLGGGRKYDILWNEVLKKCGYRNGVIFYNWSHFDTFQLPLIQDFIQQARLRPANAETLTERLDRLVFDEIDKDGRMFYEEEQRIISVFKSKLSAVGIDVSDDFPWADVINDARDMGNFRENIGGLMHNTKVPCVFVLTTPDEARHADTLNEVRLALYGDKAFVSKHNLDETERERDFWTNSVSWLVKQQGYDVCDLFSINKNDDVQNSKFLQSVLNEFGSTTYTPSPCLAVLANLTPAQLIEVLSTDERNIKFPKDVSVGLYNQESYGIYDFVSAHGGFFTIELEKPLVMPKELLSYVFTEIPDENANMYRSEAEKCGFTDDAWKFGVSMTNEPTPSIAEVKHSLQMEKIRNAIELKIEHAQENWELGNELEQSPER